MPTFRRRKKRFTRVEPMQPQDAQHQPDNSPPTSSQQPHKQPLHSPNSTTTTTSNPNNNNNNNSKAIVCGDDEDRHASSNSNTSSARGSRRSSHIQPTTTATETEGDETETSPSPSLRRPAAHTRHSTDVPRSSGSSKGDSALGHDDRATWMARVKEVGGSSIEDNVDNNHNGEDDAHGVSKVVTEVVGQEQGARRFIRSKTLHDQVVRRVPTMSVGVDGDDSVDGNDSANMLACKHEDVIAESTLGTTAPADASSAATPTPSHNHQPTSTSSDTNNNSHDHHHTSSHSHSDTNTAPSPSRQTSTSTATTATTAAAAATATALEQEEEEASIMPGQVDTRPITPQRVTRRFRQLSFDLSTTHNNNNNNNNNNDDGDGDGDGDGDQTSPKRKSPIRQLSDGAARLWSPFKRKRRTQSKDSDTSDVVSPIKTQTRQPSSGTASVQSLGETGSPRNRSPSPQHNDSKTDRKLLLAGRTHRSQFAMEALRRTPTIFEEDEDDEDEEEDKVKETGATAQRRIDQLSGFGQNHSTQQTTSPPPFRRQPAEQHDDVPDAGEGNPTLGASRSSSASSASSSSSSSSTTSDQPKQRDRSDSQVPTKTNLMHCKDAPVYIALACCFIDDAMHGRLANGKNKMYFEKWLVQRIFLVHTSQLWLHFVYAVAILLATLTFFEPPSADSFKPWTLGLEFFCIMVFITDIGMKMYYMGAMAYWSKNWHKMQIVFVCLFLLDAVIFSITGNTIRFSRFVRPAILLGRHRELRHTYFIISAMLPRLAKVFTMMFAFIGLFGIIGIHIFAEEYTGVSNDEEISQLEGTFDNFLRAFLRLFVLFTTENYPYVVVPAYQRDSATFIFFFAFVYAGVFFLTAMLLGLVVSTYFDYTAKQIHAERKKEWRGLMRAFALLDPDGNGYVTLSTWFLLMRYLRPDIDRKQAKFFFELLDRDGNNRLDCFDFLDLREIMLLKIRPTPASELNTTMQRRQWTRFRILAFNITTSSWFHPAILAALAINALVACVYHVSITQTELAALQSVHVVFALVFVAEIVLTIVSEDWYTYIASKWNVADLFIIPSALLCHCLSFVSFEWGHFFTLAGNCLLFVRLLWVSRDARFGLVLIWNIIEAVLHLSYIMAVVMYLFGVAGTELFHGYTPADPTTAYYFDFGCNMGFRSMGCACFTLFQVMTTSNWQEPMNDLIVEAGWGSAVYFVLFFIMINLVLTDLLVAVTIEAFLLAKRHFQGISADAIHTAFVEIPEDDDDEEEEEDYMAPADDMRGSNGYDGGRGGGSGGDFSSGMGRNAPPSDPQPRRGTVVEQGKADVSREKSPAVLRLEADDLVHRARRRSFQSISVPVGQSERPSPHKDRTSIPVIISTRQQSLDSNPEHKRHQSIPIISETLVDAPTININNDSVDGDDGDDDEGTHLLSPVTRRQSSPATTTTTTTTTTTGATEAATTTSRKHLTLPSRVDSIGFDDVGNGMPSKQRSSSSSFALQNRQGWRRKSIRDRLRSIVRSRSQAAKDPTLYRVYRCKQSWRREIAGQDEALELIEERDLDKMAKDARGLPIHSMHQHKYRVGGNL
ncbi:hypothetical protein PTSG_01632 [Salpingoeca rosetta]|uniref:EF-hand domain-containing protein n=1 Tax=Salpingoeca rosetta (strain ATCC 50818 / BSB-021) TaxID=946362 RepID=F2TYI0_SALR5|nr:uncharacterized protein PTSG_01632 [Salpingoeca rosetta]EGD78654.1 hypothetical protein PTSG_01632 [Salpingoeca rosetta]|eukprot:XP_004997612.1 hypothetical protein PTSG_01632 [Salpingoeca rosetta]